MMRLSTGGGVSFLVMNICMHLWALLCCHISVDVFMSLFLSAYDIDVFTLLE